jgi:hypothetical protein
MFFYRQAKLPVQTIGRYSVSLRLPNDGVFAGEAIDIEFRVLDNAKVDPVLGATGVARVQTKVVITMPEMAGMPAQNPKVHSEGVPGDYGIECFFPHGGQYQLALSLQLPNEKQPLLANFFIEVADSEARKNKKPAPKPYFLEVRLVKQVIAEQPAELRFFVRETKTKQVVRDFEIAHTKLFHLLLVSKDLSWFAHEHPMQQSDGSFFISQSFPSGGEFLIYGDVAPKNAGSQILGTTLKVSGKTPRPTPLKISPTKNTVDGMTALLKMPTPLPISKSTTLVFSLTDSTTSKAITDLEPYLGAFGHLMLIHQDGQTVVHSHPAEDEVGLAASKLGTVAFLARFPRPGVYKAWGQFQRGGKVITIPFVLSVGGER